MEQDAEMIAEMTKAYEMIEARELLNQLHVTSYPHMKQADRSKFDRDLRKRASNQKPRKLTMAEMAEVLNRGRN